MMRPRTGQRKAGPPAALLTSSSASGLGLAIRPVCVGSTEAIVTAAGAVAGFAAACATGVGVGTRLAAAVALGLAAGARPGIVRFWPSRTCVCGSILLALARSFTGTL